MAISKRDRRNLMILGAIVAVAAIYMLFFSGGGSKATSGAPATTGAQAAVVVPTPTPTPSGSDPSEALVFSGRDPFLPLLGATTDTATPIPGASTTPSVSPAGSPPSGPTGGSSTTIGGHTVVLVDIFSSGGVQKVQVEVDGTVYTVTAGDSFNDSFQLSSIDGDCANFLFGDQPFTLCQTANK
jgi:hypothetical protein